MRTLLLAVICLAAAFPAPAQTTPPAPVRPSRLGLCAACHGPTGHASLPGVPNLAGQQLAYLRDVLHQYRDGRRAVPLMRAAIGPLSEAELDALARWYSVQTPQPRS